MHLDKGTILLGENKSFAISLEQRNRLVDLGFNPSIIKIHPNDCVLATLQELLLQYGAKVVGSRVGTDEYILHHLQEKAMELKIESDKLIECDDIQQRYLFLRWCYGSKINHILRTTYPSLPQDLATSFDNSKKKVLCSLLQQFEIDTLLSWLWTQACFTIDEGVLLLKDSTRTSYAAFLASATDCIESTVAAVQNFTNSNVPYMAAKSDSLRYISENLTYTIMGRIPIFSSIEVDSR